MFDFKFDRFIRPNYELGSAIAWVLCILVLAGTVYVNELNPSFLYIPLAVCCVWLIWQSACALSNISKVTRLSSFATPIPIKVSDLIPGPKSFLLGPKGAEGEVFYLGTGFIWLQRHTQASVDILESDLKEKLNRKTPSGKKGVPWLQKLDIFAGSFWYPVESLAGHLFAVGLPGSGKTRFFDLLICQAIMRDEAVFIIDAKGDKDLPKRAKLACQTMGREDKFVTFHVAFPNESIPIDLLANFNNPGELATRIASLLPGSNLPNPFVEFSRSVVDNICRCILFCHRNPNLLDVRRYVEGGFEGLVTKSVTKLAEQIDAIENNRNGYKAQLEAILTSTDARIRRKLGDAVVKFYQTTLEVRHRQDEISALISNFEHNQEHFQKMISTLIPILQKLTSEPFRDLLSPTNDSIPSTDIKSLLVRRKVTYICLDSLSDAETAHTIASLIFANLAAASGDILNHCSFNEIKPVNVFVDEACEVLNQPFIQLLNKGRAAGFIMYVATQSISDLAAALGSEAYARQILGNFNTKVFFRTPDKASHEHLVEILPNVLIRRKQVSQSVSNISRIDEKLEIKESPLVPPQILPLLPDLECFVVLGGQLHKLIIPIIDIGEETTSETTHTGSSTDASEEE